MNQKVWKKVKKIILIYLMIMVLIGSFLGFVSVFTNFNILNIDENYLKINSSSELLNNLIYLIISIALGIVDGILAILWIVSRVIIEPFMNAAQDVIFILLSGEIITSAFNISYKWYISTIGIIFVILMIIFIALGITSKKDKNIIKNIIKAILLFLSLPLFFTLFFNVMNQLSILLSKSDLNSNSIFDTITKYTIDQIDLTVINGDNVWIEFGLLVSGLLMIYTVFIFFLKFIISLSVRIYEIIIFGIIGISFSTSSSIYDEGKRLSLYNSVLLTKITNAFICFIGYLIVISFLPFIQQSIVEANFNLDLINYGTIEGVQMFLIISTTIGSFVILSSLSNEWAFTISGDIKGGLATQMNQIDSSLNTSYRTFKKGLNYAERLVKKGVNGGNNIMKNSFNNLRKDFIKTNNGIKKEINEIKNKQLSNYQKYEKDVENKGEDFVNKEIINKNQNRKDN